MRRFFVGVSLVLASCSSMLAAEPKAEWTVRRIDGLEARVTSIEQKLDKVLAKMEAKEVPASASAKKSNVFVAGTWYTKAPDGTLAYCQECNAGQCATGECVATCANGTCQPAPVASQSYQYQTYQLSGYQVRSSPAFSACGTSSGFSAGICGASSGGPVRRVFGAPFRLFKGLFGCGG